jgi:hypothetical protein
MKLKRKPTKPERKTIKNKLRLAYYEGCSLQAVIDDLDPEVALGDILLEDIGFDAENLELKWEVLESEAKFEKRLAKYVKDLAAYEEWYEKNKSKIIVELEAKRAKDMEKLEKQAKTLEKKIKSIEKKIGDL